MIGKGEGILFEEMDISSLRSIVRLAKNSPEEYNFFFNPKGGLLEIFDKSKLDKYYMIISDGALSGYFSLRGLDDGYRIPRFGIYILYEHKEKGLGKFALKEAIRLSKELNYSGLDLKVNPKNKIAINLYCSLGFAKNGSKGEEDIYFLEL